MSEKVETINLQINQLILKNLSIAAQKSPSKKFGQILIDSKVLRTRRIGSQFDYDIIIENPGEESSMVILERMK